MNNTAFDSKILMTELIEWKNKVILLLENYQSNNINFAVLF